MTTTDPAIANWRDERDQIQARVLLDSISPEGHRLTTMGG